ncbi:Serine/threonine-protein kinase US3 [Cacatuid alphaherpesvirus 2]|uniref:Serine/threonine-protein kinase US3 n=1 Tax=Cacatuid alphaherpesvirus 2 TaxID=2604840 RepID=A0A5B9QZX4_9ALPH|nr:Serine/threonine-protein kinase US3 [Cacatuid alphaherpesvirus 2]QEG54068.1 Serine/threonine-protein kinase US3 [Cacatuid alphaherpesvirus 2]
MPGKRLLRRCNGRTNNHLDLTKRKRLQRHNKISWAVGVKMYKAVETEEQKETNNGGHDAETERENTDDVYDANGGQAEHSSGIAKADADQSPEFLDKYTVIGTLPSGSFGKIFVCTPRETNDDHKETAELQNEHSVPRNRRFVAKRVLTRSNIETFLNNEITVLLFMKHENILNVEEVIRSSVYTYMVTKKYDHDLYSFMYDGVLQWKDRPLLRQTRSIMKQILCGVQYMHTHNLIHRDIKLENVFVNDTGKVVIGDLGTVVAFKQPRTAHNYGWVGTVTTNSPEMLAGDQYCEITDIWSCGLIMLDMLSNEVMPLNGNTKHPEKQLRKLIKALSVCDEEFPDPPCKLFNYIDAVRYTHTPLSVPPMIRRMDLPMDFEYPLAKMLTFDWHRRPSATEVLAMSLFSSNLSEDRSTFWGVESGAYNLSSWKPRYD